MKKLRINEQVLQDLFKEKYEELMKGTSLPTSFTVQVNPTVKLSEDLKVEVLFRSKAYKKMLALIDKCPKEIGWHGIVDRKDKTHFEITDIVIFPQYVTGSTVTPDETEYTQWLIQFACEHPEEFNHMRFHGHSHVNMATSPSGVDTDYQKNMAANIDDFYIFGIFNKKGSWWMNIWDFENNTLYESEDISYVYEPDDTDEWADDAIKENVKTKPVESKYQYPAAPAAGKVNNTSNSSKKDYSDYYDDYDEESYGWYGSQYCKERYGYDGYGKGNKSKKGYNGYNYD